MEKSCLFILIPHVDAYWLLGKDNSCWCVGNRVRVSQM